VNELLAAVLAYRVFSRLTTILSLGMREGGCRDRPDLSRQRKDVVKRSRPDQAEEINLGALLESERSTFDVSAGSASGPCASAFTSLPRLADLGLRPARRLSFVPPLARIPSNHIFAPTARIQ
jgi:hypothetical protein